MSDKLIIEYIESNKDKIYKMETRLQLLEEEVNMLKKYSNGNIESIKDQISEMKEIIQGKEKEATHNMGEHRNRFSKLEIDIATMKGLLKGVGIVLTLISILSIILSIIK